MLDIVWAFIRGSRNTILPIVTAVVGFIVGLVLFGWYLTPVAFIDAGPQDLRTEDYMQIYLRTVAKGYAADLNPDSVRAALGVGGQAWPDVLGDVCNAISWAQLGYEQSNGFFNPPDQVAAQQLRDMALVLDPNIAFTDQGLCPEGLATTPAADEGGINFLNACLLGLLLLGLLAVFFVLWQRRGGGGGDIDFAMPSSRAVDVPSSQPAGYTEVGTEENVTPIASYRTTFSHGNDVYDDSFTIENVNGDFLGECGIDIAESIGTDSPKHVTAIEVWLFDKNDIRTITKVAMSDHAFFDEAIKAKLAQKGEPVLARPDEVIVLETASLIINARITEVDYGENPDVPPQSYFERFAVELSAWAKDSAGGQAAASYDFDEVE